MSLRRMWMMSDVRMARCAWNQLDQYLTTDCVAGTSYRRYPRQHAWMPEPYHRALQDSAEQRQGDRMVLTRWSEYSAALT